MQNLKETLESFSLSEDTRRKILNEDHPFGNQGTPFIPSEFKEIAQIALAGHFLVSTGIKQVTVQPTCVEFYYHEEAEGGIKDPIVYHRNPKNGSPKSIFKLGILHNHVSGIDITFEKGTHPEDAIRASLLIREFSVDGNPPDSRSTLLYDMLYSQASIFDGFSIKWVDGEEKVEVEADVRKNVAKYDENGQKMQAKEHQELLDKGFTLTKDKKHIQDPRPWQFKKDTDMIVDKDTNQVFVSEWLPKVHPAFFSRFSELLKNVHINMTLLSNTADIWCRDYMPIQLAEEDFLQYQYYPDYLTKKESDKQYITDTKSVCNALKLPNIQTTDLIIDGGNVVKAHDCIIMTEKVFYENAQYPQAEVLNELENLFHCEVIMLPWDKYEKYGHADGIVKPIDESHLLMTNYADYDQELAEEFERRFATCFRIEKLHYHVQRADKRNWAYINFLQVGNNIVLPAINKEEDEQAMEQIKTYYPSCNIYQLDSEEIIKQGGALNCITWNIKK